MTSFPEQVTTDRLELRRWSEGDLDAFAEIWADPYVHGALRPGRPAAPDFVADRFEHHIRHWDEFGFGLWRAEERATGRVAGWIGASHPKFVPDLADQVEIGWALRRPFWGRRLATEGAQAATRAAFEHLEIDRVISLIAPRNPRSIAVATRLGMRHEQDVHHPELGEELRVYALGRPAQAGPGAPLASL